ncbi:hypothetical protein ACFCW6_06615 [Streptomyces sp. NPDC056333]|uniref:hypothetical protein n=1 Tax=Streptomyces sp. NPDC056333 TaxID=3345786 RepID=UPI0035E3457D
MTRTTLRSSAKRHWKCFQWSDAASTLRGAIVDPLTFGSNIIEADNDFYRLA